MSEIFAFLSNCVSSGGLFALYFFSAELKKLGKTLYREIEARFITNITIRTALRDNRKIIDAIYNKILEQSESKIKRFISIEGSTGHREYKPDNGRYSMVINDKRIYINISDNKIKIFGINLANEVLKEIMDKIYQECDTKSSIKITTADYSNSKSVFAIYRKISECEVQTKKLIATDGSISPNYNPDYGTYSVLADKKTIHININKSRIKVYGNYTNQVLKEIMDKIYCEYNVNPDIILSYTLDGTKWGPVNYHRPLANMKITADMQRMFDDVTIFFNQQTEKQYEIDGHPYRCGYLIHGKTGTGKTSIVRKIAATYKRPYYSINLNSSEMNDAIFINLVTSVPVNSIILIDEIDKQYKAIKSNPNVHISETGFLAAICGPIPMKNGTIIILTANDTTVFDKQFYETLIRLGRIDKEYHFTEIM